MTRRLPDIFIAIFVVFVFSCVGWAGALDDAIKFQEITEFKYDRAMAVQEAKKAIPEVLKIMHESVRPTYESYDYEHPNVSSIVGYDCDGTPINWILVRFQSLVKEKEVIHVMLRPVKKKYLFEGGGGWSSQSNAEMAKGFKKPPDC